MPSWPILSLSHFSDCKIGEVYPQSYSSNFYPHVFGFSKGGDLSYIHDEISLYCFCNALISLGSDVILCKDRGLSQRFNNYPFSNLEITKDRLLQRYSANTGEMNFTSFSKLIKIEEVCFHLCGVHSNHWAHFICEHLPRILALKQYFGSTNHISIIIPASIDPHIKELIIYATEGQSKLITVKSDELIHAKKVLWCSETAYLMNHSLYWHPSAIFIPDWTKRTVRKFLECYPCPHSELAPSRKLYFPKMGARSLVNDDEIMELFVKKGYIPVYAPHKLELSEKISLYRSASHFVGASTSSFMNILFNKGHKKVMYISNFARSLDPILASFFSRAELQDFHVLIGNNVDTNNDLQSSFHLPIDVLKRFLAEYDFS